MLFDTTESFNKHFSGCLNKNGKSTDEIQKQFQEQYCKIKLVEQSQKKSQKKKKKKNNGVTVWKYEEISEIGTDFDEYMNKGNSDSHLSFKNWFFVAKFYHAEK